MSRPWLELAIGLIALLAIGAIILRLIDVMTGA